MSVKGRDGPAGGTQSQFLVHVVILKFIGNTIGFKTPNHLCNFLLLLMVNRLHDLQFTIYRYSEIKAL